MVAPPGALKTANVPSVLNVCILYAPERVVDPPVALMPAAPPNLPCGPKDPLVLAINGM
jgi:hypothetical protein